MHMSTVVCALLVTLAAMMPAVSGAPLVGTPVLTCQGPMPLESGDVHEYGPAPWVGKNAPHGHGAIAVGEGTVVVEDEDGGQATIGIQWVVVYDGNLEECGGAMGYWGPIPNNYLGTDPQCVDIVDNDGDGGHDFDGVDLGAGPLFPADAECGSFGDDCEDTPGIQAAGVCTVIADVPAEFDGEYDYGQGGAWLDSSHHSEFACVQDASGLDVAFNVGTDGDGDRIIDPSGLLSPGPDWLSDVVQGPSGTCNAVPADFGAGVGPPDYNGMDQEGYWVFVLRALSVRGDIPECWDEEDNDGDGFTDFSATQPLASDPQCASYVDDDEMTPGLQQWSPSSVPGGATVGIGTTGHVFT